MGYEGDGVPAGRETQRGGAGGPELGARLRHPFSSQGPGARAAGGPGAGRGGAGLTLSCGPVGNKNDDPEHKVVETEDAYKFAGQMGIQLFETSAKENVNVEEVRPPRRKGWERGHAPHPNPGSPLCLG